MKEYEVRLYMDFTIEAENEAEAINKAELKLGQALQEQANESIFGTDVKFVKTIEEE